MSKQFQEVSKELFGLFSLDQQGRRQIIDTDRKNLNKINVALMPIQDNKSIMQIENAVNQQQFVPFINERDSQGRIFKNVFQKENNLTNNKEDSSIINQSKRFRLPKNLQKTCLRENKTIGKQEQEIWKLKEQIHYQNKANQRSIRRPESLGQLCNSYQKQKSKIFEKFQQKQKLYNNEQSMSNKITPKKNSFQCKEDVEQRQRAITLQYNSIKKNNIYNARSVIQLPQIQNLKNTSMDQNLSNAASNSARQKADSSNMLKQLQIKYFKEATNEFHKFQPSLVKDFQQFPVNFDNNISNLKTAASKLVQKWKKVQDRILLINY